MFVFPFATNSTKEFLLTKVVVTNNIFTFYQNTKGSFAEFEYRESTDLAKFLEKKFECYPITQKHELHHNNMHCCNESQILTEQHIHLKFSRKIDKFFLDKILDQIMKYQNDKVLRLENVKKTSHKTVGDFLFDKVNWFFLGSEPNIEKRIDNKFFNNNQREKLLASFSEYQKSQFNDFTCNTNNNTYFELIKKFPGLEQLQLPDSKNEVPRLPSGDTESLTPSAILQLGLLFSAAVIAILKAYKDFSEEAPRNRNQPDQPAQNVHRSMRN